MALRSDFTEVYARPGDNFIIDYIDPETGLTGVREQTEAEVLEREPLAVRMPWETFRQAMIARQKAPIVWRSTTKRKYWEMLEVLPPALQVGGAFLVGEPMDHDAESGRPRFTAYWERGSSEDFRYYLVASRPLTVAELRAEIEGRRIKPPTFNPPIGAKVRVTKALISDTEKELAKHPDRTYTVDRYSQPHGYAVIKDTNEAGGSWHVHPEALEEVQS